MRVSIFTSSKGPEGEGSLTLMKSIVVRRGYPSKFISESMGYDSGSNLEMIGVKIYKMKFENYLFRNKASRP